ncbi:MAG: hypothetical protein U0326_42000 [Polyangiales bacterium]
MRRRTMLLLPLALAGGAAGVARSRRDAPRDEGAPLDAALTLQRVAMGTVWQVVLPEGSPSHAPRPRAERSTR